MKKNKTSVKFVCSSCGYESIQWYGKCPNCGEWETLKEFRESRGDKGNLGGVRALGENKPIKLSEITTNKFERFSSGIAELDRVLGGGFIPGEVVLLAGEPGVGKSTLLLNLGEKGDLGETGEKGKGTIVYVTGEESPQQIKQRAERLGVTGENLIILAETGVERVIGEIGEIRGKGESIRLLIIDSVQTLWSEGIEGAVGSISQVKGCTQKLIQLGKSTGIAIVLIGQINKEGEIAGPMMLSHMVDAVLFLEGERFTELRLLRGLKNRFGPTDEVGVFRMSEKGMEEVKNPSELFLEGNEREGENKGKIGGITVCIIEGTRPMLLEIQALVTKSSLAIPRRVVSGVDYNRVSLLAAVLQKILHLPLYDQDIFVKVSGGFRIAEPAADLGICLAIVSSFKNLPIAPKTVAFGEVGLLGEVRKVAGEEKRMKEAKKLGFSDVLSSQTVKSLDEAAKKIIIENKREIKGIGQVDF
jgi:DNA repair protein RadA/Sms